MADGTPPARLRPDSLDPGARDPLHRLEEIRAALVTAPGLCPPPGTWAAVLARVEARDAARSSRRFWSMAAAALVVLGVGGAVLLEAQRHRAPDARTVVADLISESQRIERARRAVALDPRAWTERERGLALRINDVDMALSAMQRGDRQGRVNEANLWETRVDLLQALMEEERAARVRHAVY